MLVQKVINSSVEVDSKIVSKIDKGFLVFVGFTFNDNYLIIDKMINKLLKLRIFEDENNKTNLSIFDVNGQILIVPQFTLYADPSSNRPSFTKALSFNQSNNLFEYLKEYFTKITNQNNFGIFGADMKVNLINDGPFTILLDSEELYGKS